MSTPATKDRLTGEMRVTLVLASPALRPTTPLRYDLDAVRVWHRRLTRSRLIHPPEMRSAQLRVIARFAAHCGLQVIDHRRATNHVVLCGPRERIARAFGVLPPQMNDRVGFHWHARNAPVPAPLRGVVVGVLGLNETPASFSRLHRALMRRSASGSHADALAISDQKGAATARSAAPIPAARFLERYRVPSSLDGARQRIAVVALGGGYHRSDIDAYFHRFGLRAPNVRDVSVDGATNTPVPIDRLNRVVRAYNVTSTPLGRLWQEFSDDLAEVITTVETTMDIQITGAAAPAADIEVYFAPNSPQGLYHAMLAAIGDDGADHDRGAPAAISISWGWSEAQITGDDAALINSAVERAWSYGTCVCCASGDSGSVSLEDQDPGSDAASVLFPASSPWALACGGTMLPADNDLRGVESAWNQVNRGVQQATGGGVSGAFAAPPWQVRAGVPARSRLNGYAWIAPSIPPTQRAALVGRGVPDISAYAAQLPGYELVVGGVECGAGGTSAAAPLCAGLIARLAESIGTHVRWLPQILYDPLFASACRSVVEGTNAMHGATSAASFSCGPGWNPCCGLGTPDVTRILELIHQELRPEQA
jgi:kumamolisin